jgi:hypothetical protein
VLREDGTLIPTTYFGLARSDAGRDAAARSIEYVRRHWKYSEPEIEDAKNKNSPGSEYLLDRVKNYSLCISGMAFQDAWNIDLERLRRCCIHVVTERNTMIPFCAYYLTDSHGRRLVDVKALG